MKQEEMNENSFEEETKLEEEVTTENADAADIGEEACQTEEETSEEAVSIEEALLKQIELLQEEIKEKDDRLLRSRAEFDNYRRRTQKEKEELYQMATADCVLSFLEVLDNLERAAEADGDAAELKKGVDMILKQFREHLAKIDVKEIEALGAEFDPELHNAVNRIEDENYGENVVCQVFQKGYTIKDKALRCAMVVVANP